MSEYYTYFQQSKFRQAEALVTEESKDAFYTMNKARHMGFSIGGVTFSDDIKSARILVTLQMIMPMMGSRPVPFPVSTQWRLVDGEWLAHIPQAKPGDTVETPFGPKQVVERDYAPRTPIEIAPRPDLKSVGRMYRLDRNALEFPTSAAGPVQEVILFKNRSRGELSVHMISKPIKGLKIEMTPESIPAGEEGELTFTYEPAVRQLRRKLRVRFVVEPIAQRFAVKVNYRDRQTAYRDEAGVKYGEAVALSGEGRQSLDITGLTPGQTYRVSARAKVLEGDDGEVYLAAHEGNRRAAATGGPFQLAAGDERTLIADFQAGGSAMMRVDLGYTGNTGRASWSAVSVTPLLRVNPPVVNHGFESAFLYPWKTSSKIEAKIVNSPARSGKGTVKLSGEAGYIYQDVSGLTPGSRYEVNVWARSDGRPAVAALGLHDKRNNHKESSGMLPVSVSAYAPLAAAFTASETGVVRVHLTYHGGEGAVYFDDVTVGRAGTSNGGFEDKTPAPWIPYGETETAIEKEIVFGGGQSLAQNGAPGGVSQTITKLDSNKRYQVIAWVRAAPDANVQASLKLSGDGAVEDGPRTVTAEYFEPFAVDFKPQADGTIELQLDRGEGSGALYWDDVLVRERGE